MSLANTLAIKLRNVTKKPKHIAKTERYACVFVEVAYIIILAVKLYYVQNVSRNQTGPTWAL